MVFCLPARNFLIAAPNNLVTWKNAPCYDKAERSESEQTSTIIFFKFCSAIMEKKCKHLLKYEVKWYINDRLLQVALDSKGLHCKSELPTRSSVEQTCAPSQNK